MAEYYCNNCEWEGSELIVNEDGDNVCPFCGRGNCEDYDAISLSDYEKENPREVPNE